MDQTNPRQNKWKIALCIYMQLAKMYIKIEDTVLQFKWFDTISLYDP